MLKTQSWYLTLTEKAKGGKGEKLGTVFGGRGITQNIERKVPKSYVFDRITTAGLTYLIESFIRKGRRGERNQNGEKNPTEGGTRYPS